YTTLFRSIYFSSITPIIWVSITFSWNPMLYDLHQLQRSFLTPLSAFTDTGSQIFSHPYSPLAYTPFSRHIAAGYELIHRLGKDYEKPAWGLDSTQIEGKKV